jgi:ADP-ribose pyrophosphatase YjhB (NUDIX family)
MNKIICSGTLFYSLSTKRYLLLRRTNTKQKNVWGLVGGTNENSETPWEALKREIKEEIGQIPDIKKTIPLETFISTDQKFFFHTYLCVIDNEFIPILNDEHDGYAWVKSGSWPKPLHQGLRNTLNSKVNQNKLETLTKVLDLLS